MSGFMHYINIQGGSVHLLHEVFNGRASVVALLKMTGMACAGSTRI